MERTCIVSWNYGGAVVARTVPFLYDSDIAAVEKLLFDGFAVCLSPHCDIAFASPYHARLASMAESGETLIYPDGRVITILARRA